MIHISMITEPRDIKFGIKMYLDDIQVDFEGQKVKDTRPKKMF